MSTPAQTDSATTRWRYIFVSPDALVGAMLMLGVYFATVEEPKLRQTHLFDVSVGIGVALLAIAIAALAILAAFLNDDYMRIIQAAHGDTRQAFEPYLAVAVVSGLATLFSVIGLFVWPIAPGWAQSLLMGLAIGFAGWSVVGSVQLVGITATHGRHRFRIPEIRAAYKQAREEHQESSR